MKNFVPFLLLLIAVVWSSVDSAVPDCDHAKVDNCTLKLVIIGDENYKYPNNLSEMNKHCKGLKKLEGCVKEYSSKCLDSAARQSISVLSYSISRTHRGFCTNNKRKNLFITLGQCIHPNRKEFASVMKEMSRNFQGVSLHKNSKLRVPLLCCNFFKTKDKILNQIVTKRCPELYDEADNLISSYANDILNVLCTDYSDDSDKCDQIIDQTPKWNKPLKWQSFIMPLVEVINSLDEDI